MNASKAGPEVTSPSRAKVALSATMMPAFFSAMTARNSPMPAEMASFSDFGIALKIHSRTGSTLNIRNSTPDRNTAPSATCQLWPIWPTTV